MIELVCPPERAEAGGLVLAALRRSASYSRARLCPAGELAARDSGIAVLVEPGDEVMAPLAAWRRGGPRKLLVFGSPPAALAREFGFAPSGVTLAEHDARSRPAPLHASSASPLAAAYGERARALAFRPWTRHFERFDFADEWNNLGHGAIRADGSIWAASGAWRAEAGDELAAIRLAGQGTGASFAALADQPGFSLLWFDRPAGPIDGADWRLVESFIASHREDELPCSPVLGEVPFGHDAAVTMRLDCDEDVASAGALADACRGWGVPLSLAVLTRLLDEPAHRAMVRRIGAEGGSILSHSATHAPSWGGGYDAALAEAEASAEALAAVTGERPRFAVSPFHETPPAARRALADAGYDGVIGGRIGVDPDFLLARGGAIHGVEGLIGHSQQCMLHGDCLLAEGDPLATYFEAFDLACASRTLFGYLDHPFSARYAYGWTSEEARIAAHGRLIAHIRAAAARPLFLAEDDALGFLRFKAACEVRGDGDAFRIDAPESESPLALAVEYRGRVSALRSERVFA